jgi:hypothetical protein
MRLQFKSNLTSASATRTLFVFGSLLLALAGATLLGQAGWWFTTGNWMSVSFLDALDMIDVAPGAWLAVQVSDIAWTGLQDIVWYTLAEAPLAGLLGLDGGLLVAIGLYGRVASHRRGGASIP